MRFGLKSAGVAFLFFVSLVGVSFAQTGSVTGQVFDPGGAVVPNATVTAKSETTALTRTATTTSAGIYNFAALPPSMYTVTVEAQGFQTIARSHVVLNVAATLPVNFNLQLAGAVASVDVQDVTVAPVETDSFQLSTVINSKQINDLPLILRDPYQLTLLAPGVVTSTNNDGGFSVNGQRDRNNNFMLDGADNNDTSVPGIPGGISSANPDSTQEFRVITNNFDAEFGRNTGAIIDVVTRAGGNQFHGDAYEFGRYNALGARDFFNKKGSPQDPYVRNNFGASVGGPIWKDHSFFFLNGDVQRFRTTRTSSQTTPTAAFKTGKFNFIDQSKDGLVTPVDLTDPANPNNFTGLGPDPLVAKILAITPVGVDNGDGVSTTYNFASPDALNAYNLTGRFDQKLSDRHQLTVRYIYGHSADTDPFHDEVLPGYGNTAAISTSHNGVISIASSLSANATNLVRGSFNLSNSGFFCNHAGIDAINGTDSFGNGRDITLPYFSFTFGCSALGDSNAQARLSSTLLFADTFTLTKGAHSMKFGGEYRSVKDNNFDNFASRDA
ncbi:MAG: carboxypeptidase-like regulatory domain-containing protein, partial [Edaphobacter sp.]